MTEATVIPILPTRNLRETLEYYVALGFQVTHEQHAPYVYGAVEYQNIKIHFHGSKVPAPNTESSHIALIIVHDVDALHNQFVSGIKTAFGKQFRKGIPRIGTVNSFTTDRRFNLLDPSGNRLIVVQELEKTSANTEPKATTPLGRAIQASRLFAYSKDDPPLAAKRLDKALLSISTEPSAVRFRAWVLRADIATMLGDAESIKKCLLEARKIKLDSSEDDGLSEEIQRLKQLEAEFQANEG